jgi:hypothetical protein
LVPQRPGFILLDRKTAYTPSRKGLLVALDLEQYDYNEGSQSLIRPTEGTILDRLPPRIAVREKATIELPHIMVLIDDLEKIVIEPLCNKNLEEIYDVELMLNGGHITGYKVEDEKDIYEVADNLSRLADQKFFNNKYHLSGKAVLLYAVGDGNHSFATAKIIWENLKSMANDKRTIIHHPARYVLVELVNVHDEGLSFEPIHRVVFNIDAEEMLQNMESFFNEQGSKFTFRIFKTLEALQTESNRLTQANVHVVPFVNNKKFGILIITNPRLNLETATLQSFLDNYFQKKPHTKIDYIHEVNIVTQLGSQSGNIGFYLPAMAKHNLFKTIILDGELPRKTFSMGKANEKRFYFECRKITV